MIFIILGLVIVFLPSLVLTLLPPNQQFGRIKSSLRYVGIALIVIGALSKCIIQVDAGYVGVQKLFGKVLKKTLTPGLNFVNPMVNVYHMDVKVQNYTMSSIHAEGDVAGDDAMGVLTKDGLRVAIDMSVLFDVIGKQAPFIINSVGESYKKKIVRPLARNKIRQIAAGYEAVQLYSTKRDEFQDKILTSMKKDFQRYGLNLTSILVRNIELPAKVKNTIEEKIQAEQEAQKMVFVLDKERQEADRKRVEAQGIADYQRIINQGLTRNQLQYEQIKAYKELAKSKNAKMIVIPDKMPVMLNP